MTKRIWRDLGLPTASFQEFVTGEEPLSRAPALPAVCQTGPRRHRHGHGRRSIVYDEAQLRARVRWVIETYRQPALVEDYLPGREFTIGVLGRPTRPATAAGPSCTRRTASTASRCWKSTTAIRSPLACTATWPRRCTRAKRASPTLSARRMSTPNSWRQSCKTWRSRAPGDWRAGCLAPGYPPGCEGEPRLMEINSLPGLSPGFSDLCVISAGRRASATRT
jgi:D-alanine-D-alanine ligase